MTHSPCNRILWNRVSSKTRAGMPCLGCTEPEFPFFELAPGTLFKTQTVMGVPKDLPTGIDKKGYILCMISFTPASVGRRIGRTDARIRRYPTTDSAVAPGC